MGSVYKRGSIWWMAYLDVAGKRQLRSTEKRDERNARHVLEETELIVANKGRVPARPATVAAWSEDWGKGRPQLDLGRLNNHVVPSLGAKRLVDVTQDDVRELVKSWRDGGKLAPRTIRNVYWAMSRMFSDAVTKGLLSKSPCVLVKGDRPKIRDKDRRWRQTAVFTRSEAQQLFTDARVPADRRTMWGLAFLAGLRLGEVSALRWRDYDPVRKPLGCLHVSSSFTRINKVEKGTKTEVTRQVPVHPALAELLAGWRATGWAKLFGRQPGEDDFVVPNREGRHLNDQNVNESRTIDFAALSMRRRRFHDARRTFISLAQDDDALPHVLKLVTHGAPASVMDLYTSLPWAKLCDAVGRLQLGGTTGAPLGATPRELQSELQTAPTAAQPAELNNLLQCPRRDSNPLCLVPAGHSSRGFDSAGGRAAGVSEHSPDEHCSAVSKTAGMARRARAILARYSVAS